MKRFLTEPLLHFLLLGAAFFALAQVFGDRGEGPRERILVSAAQVESMRAMFAASRLREPTADEMAAMIDGYVREEALCREALSLGLERDDPAVRDRLAQRMRFLGIADIEAPEPTDEQLEEFRLANPVAFSTPGLVSFDHVFLDAKVRGAAVDAYATELLEALRARADEVDPARMSDPFRRPFHYERYATDAVGRTYGAAFGALVETCPVGEWAGPVDSVYGVHLVRVLEREPGAMLPLEDVRERALAGWRAQERERAVRLYEEGLLERYEIVVEPPAADRPGATSP